MKLSDLQKKISPLPWTMDRHGDVKSANTRHLSKICLTGFSLGLGAHGKAEANNAYVHHCANALPALVEASRNVAAEIKSLRDYLKRKGDEKDLVVGWTKVLTPLESAIAAAEEVKEP